MSKPKLQVCVSFKNTEEEQDLYMYILGQTDKLVFIKNLVRQYRNDNGVKQTNHLTVKRETETTKNEIKHGKKTRSEYLK